MGPKGEIFGPFVKGSSRFLTIGLLRKMFKIRICKQLPKRECLEYHIGNCDAPCINKISQQGYYKNIELIKNILNTKSLTLFDCLMDPKGRSLVEAPLSTRRQELEAFFKRLKGAPSVQLSPYTEDRD